jgi:hypothetical protein
VAIALWDLRSQIKNSDRKYGIFVLRSRVQPKK